MKKSIIGLVAVCAALAAGGIGAAAEGHHTFMLNGGSLNYTVDDVEYQMSGMPFVRDSVLYLPVDDLLPHAEFALGWDGDKGAVIVSDAETDSYLYINSPYMDYKGERITFEHPTRMRENVLFMPITMFAQFTDDSLYVNGEFQKADVGYRDLLEDTVITDAYRIGGGVQTFGDISVVDGRIAMEKLYYADSNGTYYAGVVNAIAQALPEVQVYNMLIPSITEFYGPGGLYTDQISGIRKIYQQLDQSVIPINIVKSMWEHADEKLYFYTDHHWTQRGAYYAYRAFMDNKGEAVPELWEFPRDEIFPFTGSFPSFLKGTAGAAMVRANPEGLERFMSIVEYSGYHYHDMYLQKKTGAAKVINPSDRTYTTFINGDRPLTHFITNVKNGRKLVIVKESFGDAFSTWAVNNYEEVFVVDPRYWNGFGGNHQKFNLTAFYHQVCQFDDLLIISYPGSTSSSMRQAILNLIR